MTTVAITGNTYPVKEQIKTLGGRWDADRKAWMVPADKAEAARKLVGSAPRQSRQYGYSPAPRMGSLYGRRTGCSCGSVEGYPKATDCWTCQHDA